MIRKLFTGLRPRHVYRVAVACAVVGWMLIQPASTVFPAFGAPAWVPRNNPDRTFAWLGRAWSHQDPGFGVLPIAPLTDRFESDPRFAAFCRKAGLPPPDTSA